MKYIKTDVFFWYFDIFGWSSNLKSCQRHKPVANAIVELSTVQTYKQCVSRRVRARVRVGAPPALLELCKRCAEAQAARLGSGRPPAHDPQDDAVRGYVIQLAPFSPFLFRILLFLFVVFLLSHSNNLASHTCVSEMCRLVSGDGVVLLCFVRSKPPLCARNMPMRWWMLQLVVIW